MYKWITILGLGYSKYIISTLESLKATSYQTSQKVGKHIAIEHYLHGWIYNQNVNCLSQHLISKN
jgi:hypothetical protein